MQKTTHDVPLFLSFLSSWAVATEPSIWVTRFQQHLLADSSQQVLFICSFSDTCSALARERDLLCHTSLKSFSFWPGGPVQSQAHIDTPRISSIALEYDKSEKWSLFNSRPSPVNRLQSLQLFPYNLVYYNDSEIQHNRIYLECSYSFRYTETIPPMNV